MHVQNFKWFTWSLYQTLIITVHSVLHRWEFLGIPCQKLLEFLGIFHRNQIPNEKEFRDLTFCFNENW